MSQATSYPCNLCKRFVGVTFAKLQLHQIRGGCMSHFIREHRAGELSLQNSTLETTSNDDYDNDADTNIDVDVDVDVGMESMSNVSVGSVASSLAGNKKLGISDCLSLLRFANISHFHRSR
ncbi:hypothetical protein G6F65_022567 [Rhizopus arrhizus]|nr:hypothetical protein G6F65_022567 [Rhizopus arrhizus]